MLILARKFANYTLHVAGITKTSRNALFSLQSHKAGIFLTRFDQTDEKNNI